MVTSYVKSLSSLIPRLYINLMMQNDLKKECYKILLKHKLRSIIKMFYIKYPDSFTVD